MHGRGVSLCAFCRGRIEFSVDGNAVVIEGREGIFSALLPLYCSQPCENAKVSHLFDEVLM